METACELLHDPDSMSMGTNGLIPPEMGIFMGLERAGRFTMFPGPISTESVSIDVNGELERFVKYRKLPHVLPTPLWVKSDLYDAAELQS